MSVTPKLTDRAALVRHRNRATDLFLHEHARLEAEDRLAMVNKAFTAPVVVTPFADLWRDLLPGTLCVPDDDTLDLQAGAHDLAVHAMSLHWANDPVGQLIQCRQALRPDGLLLCVALGGQTLHELRACLAEAEIAVSGGLSPRVAPMGEIRDLGALLQRAGLALPVADSWTMKVRYESALHLMQDLRKTGETNALVARKRSFTARAVIARANQLYSQGFADDTDHIEATYEFLTLTGWAPAASQPQPLRPGSATARLADALGAKETNVKD